MHKLQRGGAMNIKQQKLNNSVKCLKDISAFSGWSFRKIRIHLKRAAKEIKNGDLKLDFNAQTVDRTH